MSGFHGRIFGPLQEKRYGPPLCARACPDFQLVCIPDTQGYTRKKCDTQGYTKFSMERTHWGTFPQAMGNAEG